MRIDLKIVGAGGGGVSSDIKYKLTHTVYMQNWSSFVGSLDGD